MKELMRESLKRLNLADYHWAILYYHRAKAQL